MVPKIFDDDIKYKLEVINGILGKKYKLEHPKEERDWRNHQVLSIQPLWYLEEN